MSGSLEHSPADILRNLLVNLGLGTTPSDSGSWPVYASLMPDTPDNVITLIDTAGVKQGRIQTSGEIQEHYGVQLLIRSTTHPVGYTKAQALAVALDENIQNNTVTISGTTYDVDAVSRRGNVLSLGEEEESNRRLFSINAIVSINQST